MTSTSIIAHQGAGVRVIDRFVRDHFVRNLHHANACIGIAAFLSKEKPRYE